MAKLGRFAESVLEACWLGVVILVPLYMDKNGAQVFDPPKAGIVRAVAIVMLAAWVTRQLFGARDPLASRGWLWRALRTPTIIPVGLVLLTTLIATVFSVAPNESIWGHVGRGRGLCTLLGELVIFAIAAAYLRTREQLQRFITAIIFPSVPIAVYAILQRFGLEPLNVTARETELERSTSLLGQPVFLAAYIGMVMPFVAARGIEALRAAPQRRGVAALYGVVLLLHVGAALVSESRGALLGVCASCVIGILFVAAHRGQRRSVIALAVAASLGLAVTVGVPKGYRIKPVGAVAQLRLAQRVAVALSINDTANRGATSWHFRSTTWHVAVRTAQNRSPLEFVDGSHDPWSMQRPLIGYGPETQYAISTPFYDSKLPVMFGYFLVDRYHSELWDVLVTTGALGLIAWLALQSSLFFLLLQGLGLLESRSRVRLFWTSYAGCALSGALAVTLMRDLAWVFFGLQAGAVLGIAVFFGALAVQTRHETLAPPLAREAPLLLALLTALVGHAVETMFSFTVTASGILFWAICALTVASVRLADEPEPAPPQLASDLEPKPRRVRSRGSRSPARFAVGPATSARAWRDAAFVAMGVAPLGLAYLGRSTNPSELGQVLWDGLTLLSTPENKRFPAVAIIAASALLAGPLLLATDNREAESSRARATGIASTLALAVLFSLAYWTWISGILAHYGAPVATEAMIVPRNLELRLVSTWSLYVTTFSLLLLHALATQWLAVGRAVREPAAPRSSWWWRSTVGIGCAALAAGLIERVALRPAAADAAAALGDALKNQNMIALAEEAYRRAVELRPDTDIYEAMLAKAYFAHTTSDGEHALALGEKADLAMQRAIACNHASGEHATNLAAIRTNRAQRSAEPERSKLLADVPALYARALRINPQDPWVWRLWASAQLAVFGNPTGALASAQHALVLSPSNQATLALLGECQLAVAQARAAAARR